MRETLDHGAMASWDRQTYLVQADDEHNHRPTVAAADWSSVSHNLFYSDSHCRIQSRRWKRLFLEH